MVLAMGLMQLRMSVLLCSAGGLGAADNLRATPAAFLWRDAATTVVHPQLAQGGGFRVGHVVDIEVRHGGISFP